MNDYKKALGLEYFTVSYNLLEAGGSLFFGAIAASVALISFGLDSVVESLAAMVLIWRLYDHHNMSEEEIEAKEKKALRFVAVTFFILGAYVAFESISTLIEAEAPDTSLPGIIIASASLIIMPILAAKKKQVGERIGSRALIADSKETLACAWLSVALLLGLGCNMLFGFWQADPIAGLIIVYFLFKEGKENWEGECSDGCDHE
jgi:divalent metal cation (Fe/Co/Zn/Cd) transporter